MENYKFNLVPGTTDLNIIEHPTDYVRYYENSSGGGTDPRILVRGLNGGWSAELLPGESIRPPKRDRGLAVSNLSGTTITGKLLVGEDGAAFTSDRFAGNVSVIDGEKSRALAGGYLSGCPTSAADPGNFSVVQLWNPSASKNLIVSLAEANPITAVGVHWYFSSAALATDQTGSRGANYLATAAAGVGQLRSGVLAAIPGYANQLLKALSMTASAAQALAPKGRVIVTPGRGLSVLGTTINNGINCNFEWFEENVA